MRNEAELWKPYSEDFDNKVFSFTQFDHHRKKIMDNIRLGLVLNVGTGPTPHLNRELILNGNRVIATDFSGAMLEEARAKFNSPEVCYVLSDTNALAIDDGQCDTVLAINSILPADPDDVCLMLRECYRTSKPGGRFVGVFPSYDWHEHAVKSGKLKTDIDPVGKRVGDTSGWQTCQTKESLERVMQTVGFEHIQIEEVPLNTPEEKKQLQALYHVDADEFHISEYFVTADRPTSVTAV